MEKDAEEKKIYPEAIRAYSCLIYTLNLLRIYPHKLYDISMLHYECFFNINFKLYCESHEWVSEQKGKEKRMQKRDRSPHYRCEQEREKDRKFLFFKNSLPGVCVWE